ncbi:MAG: DUF2946 family protein [Gammaproteobacteria bacterium]|nr:DUF2946 family protein [Gammaproteobacteria bacterium]
MTTEFSATSDAFDPMVTRAMRKWPEVPACYDWLSLDPRGRWRLQDQPVTHARTIGFLNRHYTRDRHGQWFVQNGPQRVFVSLPGAPHVLAFSGACELRTHAGRIVSEIRELVASNDGALRCLTEIGLGLFDDREVSRFLAELEGSAEARTTLDAVLVAPFAPDIPVEVWNTPWRWRGQPLSVRAVAVDALDSRYHFVSHPRSLGRTEDTVE